MSELAALYLDRSLRDYALKLTKDPHQAEELVSQTFEKLIAKGKVVNRHYVARAIRNHFLDQQRRKVHTVQVDDSFAHHNEAGELKQRVHDIMQTMHRYDRDLLDCVMDGETPWQVHKSTGIPFTSVKRDMEQAKQTFGNLFKSIKLGILVPGEPPDPETGEQKNPGINAVKYHRLLMPLAHLVQTYGIEWKLLYNGKDDRWLFECHDVTHVICSRELSSFFVQQDGMAFQVLKKQGIKVIVDVDDFWELPKHHKLFKFYKKHQMPDRYRFIIKNADVVWTTTKQLARKIEKLNKNVHIAKNALWDAQFINSETSLDFDHFYYFGGSTHRKDLSLLRGLMDPYEFSMMMTDEDRMLNAWFPNAHKIPPKFVDSYGKAYHNAGIFVIPLIENTFNSCKSELKMIEAGTFGKPCLVSAVAPYTNLATSKNSIRVKNNPDDWAKALKRIHGDHALQHDLGAQLREDVAKKHSMAKQNEVRLQSL